MMDTIANIGVMDKRFWKPDSVCAYSRIHDEAFPKRLPSLSSHFTDAYYKYLIKMVWTLAEHTAVCLVPPDRMYILCEGNTSLRQNLYSTGSFLFCVFGFNSNLTF